MRKDPTAIRKAKGSRTYNKKTDTYIDRAANGSVIEPCVDDILSPAARAITPPKTISTPRELDLFKQIVGAMPDGVYSKLDAAALAVYVHLILAHDDIIEAGRTQPRMVEGSQKQMVLSPLIRAQMELASKITSLGARLGLDPVARTSIKAPEQKSPENPW